MDAVLQRNKTYSCHSPPTSEDHAITRGLLHGCKRLPRLGRDSSNLRL